MECDVCQPYTVSAALLMCRWDRRKPHLLAGLLAGSIVAACLNVFLDGPGHTPVATLGAIGQPWPPFHVPPIDWHMLPELLSLAVTLSIVALVQSISIAKFVASRSRQSIDANRKFMGQSLSNIVGGFFLHICRVVRRTARFPITRPVRERRWRQCFPPCC
jgi:sulfate permease, SulP family